MHPTIHYSIHSFLHSFIDSFISSCCSFVYCPSICLFIHPLIHSGIHSYLPSYLPFFFHSVISSYVHSFNSFISFCVHSVFCSFVCASIYPSIHSVSLISSPFIPEFPCSFFQLFICPSIPFSPSIHPSIHFRLSHKIWWFPDYIGNEIVNCQQKMRALSSVTMKRLSRGWALLSGNLHHSKAMALNCQHNRDWWNDNRWLHLMKHGLTSLF